MYQSTSKQTSAGGAHQSIEMRKSFPDSSPCRKLLDLDINERLLMHQHFAVGACPLFLALPTVCRSPLISLHSNVTTLLHPLRIITIRPAGRRSELPCSTTDSPACAWLVLAASLSDLPQSVSLILLCAGLVLCQACPAFP